MCKKKCPTVGTPYRSFRSNDTTSFFFFFSISNLSHKTNIKIPDEVTSSETDQKLTIDGILSNIRKSSQSTPPNVQFRKRTAFVA